MKIFVDTSILMSAVLSDQPGHELSLDLLHRLRPGKDSCAAHSLAELYSSLTRMPPPIRRDAEEALLLLDDVYARVTPVSLTPDEYIAAMTGYASRGIIGGAIYDGLIARCALKAKADLIYTWNTRDFQRLGPEIEKRLRVPGT